MDDAAAREDHGALRDPGRDQRGAGSPDPAASLAGACAQANATVAGWMRAAGMTVRQDNIGNLIGRYAARSSPRAHAAAGLAPGHRARRGQVRRPAGRAGRAGRRRAPARPRRAPAFRRSRCSPLPTRKGCAIIPPTWAARSSPARFDPGYLDLRDADGSPWPRRSARSAATPTALAGDRRAPTTCWATARSISSRGRCSKRGPARRRGHGDRRAEPLRACSFTGQAGHAGTVPMALRQRRAVRRRRVRAGGRGAGARHAGPGRHGRPARGAAGRQQRHPRPGDAQPGCAPPGRRRARAGLPRSCTTARSQQIAAARSVALDWQVVAGDTAPPPVRPRSPGC